MILGPELLRDLVLAVQLRALGAVVHRIVVGQLEAAQAPRVGRVGAGARQDVRVPEQVDLVRWDEELAAAHEPEKVLVAFYAIVQKIALVVARAGNLPEERALALACGGDVEAVEDEGAGVVSTIA